MVEHADIFQDLSTSSVFSTSKILDKSVENYQSRMESMLKPDSVDGMSQEESKDIDNRILVPHESGLKPEKKKEPTSDKKSEKVRNEHVNTKSRKEDKEKDKAPESKKEEKTHTVSHEEKAPIKNRKADDNAEEDKETSNKFIKQLHLHSHTGSPSGKSEAANPDLLDEYDNDEDVGFRSIEVKKEDMEEKWFEISEQYGFPEFAFRPNTEEELIEIKKRELKKSLMDPKLSTKKTKEEDGEGEDDIPTNLPNWVKFTAGDDDFYPAEFNGVVYDCYNLKVVFDREKTGFEETREFQIIYNSIIGGRYQVMEYLGSAAFSKAIRWYDLHTNEEVCMKIIENNKDYFDQSIDEIKLLRYIKTNCTDCDAKNIIRMIDFFYHKEHLFIVTELLKDNLYEFYKYNREHEENLYFTLGRLQKVSKQILEALEYMHSLNLVHCDLKPENILMKSYSKCQVKVIDLGSSCFIHDHLSSYVQSRSYRAPEVILGCNYDYKVDIWSLGCIIAELYTGYVLFQNESVVGLLARVLGIIGPIPEHMAREGKHVSKYFTGEGILFQEAGGVDIHSQNVSESTKRRHKRQMETEGYRYNLIVPKKTNLKARLNNVEDPLFVDFVAKMLEIDPEKRMSSTEALKHPFITEAKYPNDDE